MTKVILMEPNKNPTLIEYNDVTKLKIFGNADTDGIALRAPECKNMLLAMIGYDISAGMEYNKLATLFASYLRRYHRYQENIIYGPVIIIDDNGDLDENDYKILKEMVNDKRKANYQGRNNHLFPKVPGETVDHIILPIPDGSNMESEIKKLKHPLLPGATSFTISMQ